MWFFCLDFSFRISDARVVLKQVINKWPNNGFALVHHGFILKTSDNKLEEAVDYLRKGIATNESGVIDGRFFFHLGDALKRLGRHDEAMKVSRIIFWLKCNINSQHERLIFFDVGTCFKYPNKYSNIFP